MSGFVPFSGILLQISTNNKDPQLDERYMYNGIMIDTHMNINNIRNTEEAELGPQYSPRLLYWPRPVGIYDGQGVYCGLSTASEVFLIFTTRLYQFLVSFFLFPICRLLTSLKYFFLNTPKQQYYMLLTSGG